MSSRRRGNGNNGNGEDATMASASPTISEEEWLRVDKAYVSPPFVLRNILDHEKLSGHKNFKTWQAMVELDLRALNLLPFIESECGLTINVSPGRRVMMDAQTLQYLRSSISKSISRRVLNIFTAYQTMQALQKMFGGSRVQDMVNLHERLSRLKFKIGYDADRFIADFEQIIEDYREIGTTYSDDYTKTLFLHKIEGGNDPKSPFFTFYTTVATLPNVTFDYIKEKFICVVENVPKPDRGMKRKFPERNSEPPKDSKIPKLDKPTTIPKLDKPTTMAKAKPLSEKYTKEQLAQLAQMSKEDKNKIRCGKCGEYFHKPAECPNPGRVCYKCFRYGHERKDCKFNKGKGNLFLNLNNFVNNIVLYVDSCASHHSVSCQDILVSYSSYENPIKIKTADQESELFAVGEGVLPILVNCGKIQSIIKLTGVQYIPNSSDFILSVSALNKQFGTSLTLNTKSGYLFSNKLKTKNC